MAHASSKTEMPESSQKGVGKEDETPMALPQRPITQAAPGLNAPLATPSTAKKSNVQVQEAAPAQAKDKNPPRPNDHAKDDKDEPEGVDQAEDNAQQASAKDDDQSTDNSEASTHLEPRKERLRKERKGERRMTCNHSREDRLMNVAVTGIVGFCGVIVGACIVGLFMYYQHVKRVKKEYRMSISTSYATSPKSTV